MKRIIILFLLISSVITAQETISKKLGEFHTLKVFNGIPVTIVKSSIAKIVISGDQADDVVVKNSDGILKIRMRITENFVGDRVHVKLYYNTPISVLDANEGASITGSEVVKQQHMEIKVQEGATVKLTLKTVHLIVKSVTGGRIELEGKTENQTVEATTGGMYFAHKLSCDNSVVTAASGANAEVVANEVLNANVRIGGMIYYKGRPEVLKTKKILGGKIKAVD